MTNSFRVPQLLLRLALGIGFLTTVSDRLGFLGPFGTRNVEWGNWHNFIDYTGTLMPFPDRPAVNIMVVSPLHLADTLPVAMSNQISIHLRAYVVATKKSSPLAGRKLSVLSSK